MGSAETSKSPSHTDVFFFSSCSMSLKKSGISNTSTSCPAATQTVSSWRLSPVIRQAGVGSRQERAAASEPHVLSGPKEEGSGCKFRTRGVVVGVMFALTTTD